MEIDNHKRASVTKALLISTPFVLLLASSLLALFLVIHTWVPTLISGFLVIAGWILIIILKLKFVKFRFTNEIIQVLYYPISPMTSNFKRIEIAGHNLVKFEIKPSWNGLRNELILYEQNGSEVAVYPPVSVTLFEKESIALINDYLSAYCSAGTNS
jgi:hypothetical protein